MGGDGRITATAQKFDRVERLTDVNLEEIDGDLFPEDPEPARCPDCGCDLETEDHTIDCGYDDEEEGDDDGV